MSNLLPPLVVRKIFSYRTAKHQLIKLMLETVEELYCLTVDGDGARTYADQNIRVLGIPQKYRFIDHHGNLRIKWDRLIYEDDYYPNYIRQKIKSLSESEAEELLTFLQGMKKFDPNCTMIYTLRGDLIRVSEELYS